MADDPAFLFYAGDYLRDTQCLSEKSQVAYDRIMCEHMRNICISQHQLKFFTKKLSDDEIDELMMVLRSTKDGYQIAWVAESIEKRRAYSNSRRNNRKGKKAKDMSIISKTYVNHMENEIENEDESVFENEIGNAFDEFWRLYDFNSDMVMCQREWSNIDKQEYQKIIDYVPQYVERTPDKRYRKKPLTFLKGRNWNDELPPLKEDSNFIDYSKVDYTK